MKGTFKFPDHHGNLHTLAFGDYIYTMHTWFQYKITFGSKHSILKPGFQWAHASTQNVSRWIPWLQHYISPQKNQRRWTNAGVMSRPMAEIPVIKKPSSPSVSWVWLMLIAKRFANVLLPTSGGDFSSLTHLFVKFWIHRSQFLCGYAFPWHRFKRCLHATRLLRTHVECWQPLFSTASDS